MLVYFCIIAIGVFIYCSFIYPYAAKIERRQNRDRGNRWRRWMGREDEIEDIPWAGPALSQAKPLPPPIDPDIDVNNTAISPVIPVTSDRPFKPPMQG